MPRNLSGRGGPWNSHRTAMAVLLLATLPGVAHAQERQVRGIIRESEPTVTGAGVEVDKLAAFVRARLRPLQGCYEKELRRNPALEGTVVTRWTLTPAGRTADIGTENSTLQNEAVQQCFAMIVRSWVLPFKPEKEVKVTQSFMLKPASPPPKLPDGPPEPIR